MSSRKLRVDKRVNAIRSIINGYESDSRSQVISCQPNSYCVRITFPDGKSHFQIMCDDLNTPQIGFNNKTQGKAWENAWAVISRKILKKLES
jgi:hypothetical protein